MENPKRFQFEKEETQEKTRWPKYKKLPEGVKNVGRPTKWGNPFKVKEHGREECLRLYRIFITEQIESGKLDISELRGKNLACYCKLEESCHADILLELANQPA